MVTKAQARPKTDSERWQGYINTSIQHPDRWNGYDCDIQATVTEYNRYPMGNAGYLPLSWRVVKAMVWVKTGADSEVWATRPMQIGNLSDPALNALLRSEEGSGLIVPPAIRTRLSAGLVRTVPAWSIRAGVGYLLTRVAKFDVWSVRDADDKVYEVAVKAGDSFDKIARAQGATLAEMRALNPNAVTLKSGQVVKYRKAAVCKVVTGWRPVTTQNAAALYNHGDVAYIRKLDYVLTLIPKIGTAACKQDASSLPYRC